MGDHLPALGRRRYAGRADQRLVADELAGCRRNTGREAVRTAAPLPLRLVGPSGPARDQGADGPRAPAAAAMRTWNSWKAVFSPIGVTGRVTHTSQRKVPRERPPARRTAVAR